MNEQMNLSLSLMYRESEREKRISKYFYPKKIE